MLNEIDLDCVPARLLISRMPRYTELENVSAVIGVRCTKTLKGSQEKI